MCNDVTVVRVLADGTIRFVADANGQAAAGGLPRARCGRERASDVWPAGRWRRWAFRLLRATAGDGGRVAAWTRGWGGEWLVRIRATGDVLGPFTRRADALAAEVGFLNGNVL